MANNRRMRRLPQQARGQHRVTRLLDAAAEVFAEIGYDRTTTNAIAIRANTSIGSLYQFFPNKVAILNALANGYQTHLSNLLNDVFTVDLDDLQAVLSTLIDRISAYYGANPAFQPMFYASQSSPELSQVADATAEILVGRVSGLFLRTNPHLTPAQARFYAIVVVLMMRSLIPLSQKDNGISPDEIIPQLKRMVFAYLASLDDFADQPFTLGP